MISKALIIRRQDDRAASSSSAQVHRIEVHREFRYDVLIERLAAGRRS
jgi:hypothetical protein